LADALLEGLDVREAAERLHITLETGRFHLKRVFSKTGVGRQAELIRLMMSLPGWSGPQIPCEDRKSEMRIPMRPTSEAI
jgi:hypothetical protein